MIDTHTPPPIQTRPTPKPPSNLPAANLVGSSPTVTAMDLTSGDAGLTIDPSLDFEDFNQGVEEDFHPSAHNSAFGSTNSYANGLHGALYDFKQDRHRRTLPYRADPVGKFTQQILNIQKRKFSDSSLRPYFKAPLELTLTHLAIPNSPASEGPKHFGAEDLVAPSGWLAHYTGTVCVPETGRYRFVGMGDDYLTVYVDEGLCLSASWPGVQARTKGRWQAAEEDLFTSPIGNQPLIFGDWLQLDKGQEIDLDLAIGEVPGGYLGFVLLVQKDGELYETAANGRPILPLFTTQAFFPQEEELIKKNFGSFTFDWQNVPVFTLSQ